MLVKPAPGLKVRDPATMQLVPDTGLDVSETDVFWARALRDGDVLESAVEADAPAPAADTPAVVATPPASPGKSTRGASAAAEPETADR